MPTYVEQLLLCWGSYILLWCVFISHFPSRKSAAFSLF